MDVGCRPSPVGLLPVVPDEMLMMASHGLCARLAVPKARRNSIGSVDNGGSHVSARWASSIQAVQIHLVVVVVVAGKIFLRTVRSGGGGFGTSSSIKGPPVAQLHLSHRPHPPTEYAGPSPVGVLQAVASPQATPTSYPGVSCLHGELQATPTSYPQATPTADPQSTPTSPQSTPTASFQLPHCHPLQPAWGSPWGSPEAPQVDLFP